MNAAERCGRTVLIAAGSGHGRIRARMRTAVVRLPGYLAALAEAGRHLRWPLTSGPPG
jgi:hypothetical protein